MKILVVGSGGREDTICWKLSQSPLCDKLFCAPGNGGISEHAELVDEASDDVEALLRFALDNKIDLTVVGPEVPLSLGIVDRFRSKSLRIFGPSKELALLESSKVYAKEIMKRYGVPTADFKIFDKSTDAITYIDSRPAPMVIKADGLCAGKGVVVAKTKDEAKDAVKMMMVEKVFGTAASRIIIEDCLIGEEASILVISDGKDVIPLASSQDHKRIFDSDKGPNTGGMGAYSPAPVVTDELFKRIMDTVIYPVINGLARDGKKYTGVLYAGIMVTADGPKTLEFNVRFGDPETQAILPRLQSDFADVINRAAAGSLGPSPLQWDKRPCVSVVLASGGYPGQYEKGKEIKGIEEAKKIKDVVIFHAGTKLGKRSTDSGRVYLTDGGRVLNVTALGEDVKNAIDKCYEAVGRISFDAMHYRTDIGYRAIKRG